MALIILNDTTSNDHTAHAARTLRGEKRARQVSRLPGRHMDRNAAITAMIVDDETDPGDMHPRHQPWIPVDGWAAELGMTAPEVLTPAAQAPGRSDADKSDADKSAMPAGPEATE